MSDVLSRDSLREVEAVLARRIEMLERDNELLRGKHRMIMIALAGVLVLTVVLTILTAPRAAGIVPVLQANQFVLRDETGLVRGIWDIESDGGPRLVMRDSDGRERVRLSLLRDGSPGITLGDSEGRPRVVLGLLPDGTTNLVFADAGGTTRAVLGHSSADATTLVLADRNGFTRAGLLVDAAGEGTLTLYESGDNNAPAGAAQEPAAATAP